MLHIATQHPKANDTCTSSVTLVNFVPEDGYSLAQASGLKLSALRVFHSSFLAQTSPCTFFPCLTPQAAHTPFVSPSLYLAPSLFFGAFIPEILGPAQGCSSSFLVFHQLGIPLETAWKPSHHWEAPVPTLVAQLWSPGLWQVCVGVWLWRFITCGKKEGLPLEVGFFSILKQKAYDQDPQGKQTNREEATVILPLRMTGSLLQQCP